MVMDLQKFMMTWPSNLSVGTCIHTHQRLGVLRVIEKKIVCVCVCKDAAVY